jgi:DNA-binding MarR family transcriptional regulator
MARPADPDDPLDVVQHELAILARRSERVRLAAADRAQSTLDRSGFLLLGVLDADGPRSVRDLARGYRLDVSTVTRQIQPLLDAGLIERVPHPEGARGTALRLTGDGRRELRAVRRARQAHLRRVLDDWSDEDVAQLGAMLSRLNGAIAAGDEQ